MVCLSIIGSALRTAASSYVTIQGPTAAPSAQRAIPARRGPLVPRGERGEKGEQGIQGEKGDTGETPVVTVA